LRAGPPGFASFPGFRSADKNSVADYAPLFSLLGARFGGNGVQTFALPLLEPEYSTHQEPLLRCIAYQGYYPLRP
jgi:microcystin-dependent protein